MTTAIQDDTAGIYVKLPQMPVDGIVPGRAVQVDGLLAAPFGNLEIRPTSGGVLQLDTAELPAPMALTINQLGESTEGVLAHVEGTIKRIEGGGVTSLTLIIEDATGEGRVFAHSTLGVSRDDFSVGQRVNVIGLVGDRLGLYRIWPRTRFDIVATQPDPTSTPSVTPRPTPRPTPTRTPAPTRTPSPSPRPSNAPGEVSISEALRKGGQAVTISGVATTGNGLLDADGQRVTFQDASGAILVRLPEGITARAGDRLRVTGQVGTYYNAPQLTATTATRAGDTAVQPLLVRAAPVAATLEWRLVVVTGTVESVHRDGDAWRAELTMPGGGLPIVGLERSGIDSTALVEGREATVTGIVKRAYPTASDQRFAVVPRTAADIKLGQQSAGASDAPGAPGGQGGSGDNPWGTVVASDDPYAESSNEPASPGEQPAQSVPIAELSSHLGGLVSVGGVVVAVETARFTIDDGTGVAAVVLEGEAAATVVGVSMRDLLNVTGTVTQSAAGALEIRVDDPLAVTWLDVASPSAQITTGASATVGTAAASTVDSDPATASATDTRLFAVGLLAVAGVAAGAALVASPSRRQRVREWLANAGVALKRRLSTLLSS
jgi:hypothetical protein